MNLHSCKVRLQGEVKDEVQKIQVTSAEIRVLKEIHGDDAVVEIRITGESDRSDAEERARLGQLYGEQTVTAMFGAPVATIADEIQPDEIEPLPQTGALAKATRTTKVVEPKGIAALTE